MYRSTFIYLAIGISAATAVAGYMANVSASRQQRGRKDRLRSLADTLDAGTLKELSSPMFALLLSDDGSVVEQHNMPSLAGRNLLTDNDDRTTALFKRMKSRATSGGGFSTFNWITDDVLSPHIAYSTRKNDATLCVITPER